MSKNRSKGYFRPEHHKRIFWSHRDTLVWNKVTSLGNSRLVLRRRMLKRGITYGESQESVSNEEIVLVDKEQRKKNTSSFWEEYDNGRRIWV